MYLVYISLSVMALFDLMFSFRVLDYTLITNVHILLITGQIVLIFNDRPFIN